MMKLCLGNVFILGDSYSTFCGYIPKEHDSYYSAEGRPETDVNRVEQTWWYRVIKVTNSLLVLNHSWSGTTICNTGYAGPNVPNSFIRRFDRLVADGFFVNNHIDTVFVMGGPNDYASDAPIGELKIQDWTEEDLLNYGPAVCYLMHRLKLVLPNARIIFIINAEMRSEIMDYQEKAAKFFNVEYIRLADGAVEKRNAHPTILGMKQISEQVLLYLQDYAQR